MEPVTVKGRSYSYSQTIGKGSPGGPGFRQPVDIAIAGNLVYGLSRGTEGEPCGRISVFTKNEEYLGQFANSGNSDGQFIWGSSVAVDKDGLVYLADEWLNRITVFNGQAELNGMDIEQANFIKKWGISGSLPGQINGPSGIALDNDGNLYITEELNHRVSKFTTDGEFISCWGSQGSSMDQFDHPWGITIDNNNNIYVADWKNHRIQKFTGTGEYISTIGTPGNSSGELNMPSDVAVDKDGDIYVTDWWNSKLEVYDKDGHHITTFFGDAENLSKWAAEALAVNPDIKALYDKANKALIKYFFRPTAVEVDEDNRIWVVDGMRWRIQIYQKTLS